MLALTLTGCGTTEAGPSDEAKSAALTAISKPVPAEYSHSQGTVDFSSFIPPTDSRPALLTGWFADAAQPTALTLWSSTNGTDWQQQAVSTPGEGEDLGRVECWDDTQIVMLGGKWHAGKRHVWALRSTDGVTWEPMRLPEGIPGNAWVHGCAIRNGTTYALLSDTTEHWQILQLDVQPRVWPLPEIPNGEVRDSVFIAASSSSLMMLSEEGERGKPKRWYYSTSQNGQSWDDRRTAFADPRTSITGLAVYGTTFIATGSVSRGTHLFPHVWSQSSAGEWVSETIALPSNTDKQVLEDTWLSAPTHGSRLTATLNGLSRDLAVLERTDDGRWEVSAVATDLQETRPSGVALAMQDYVVMASSFRHSAIIGTTDINQKWKIRKTIKKPTSYVGLGEVVHTKQGIEIGFNRSHVDLSADGWRTYPERLHGLLTPEGLGKPLSHQGDTAPSGLMKAYDPVTETSLSLTDSFSKNKEGKSVLSGWLTTKDGQKRSFTLPTQPGAEVDKIKRLGNLWVAVGSNAPDHNTGTVSQSGVWTSSDGVIWQPSTMDTQSQGPVGSSAEDACVLPDNSSLVIGSRSRTETEWEPAAWQLNSANHTATRVSNDTWGVKLGQLSSCIATEKNIYILGNGDGYSRLWSTSDGKQFTQPLPTNHQTGFNKIVTIPGGVAVMGTQTTSDRSTCFVWLTTDNTKWARIEIPIKPVGTMTAVAQGDVLTTFWETDEGIVSYEIPSIAKALDYAS